MKNKFYIGQKVRGFYGIDAVWGQGKDELCIITGVKDMGNGIYCYDLKNSEKNSVTYGSSMGAPEHLLISEKEWQKLPLSYRMAAVRLNTVVNQKMKEMGY